METVRTSTLTKCKLVGRCVWCSLSDVVVRLDVVLTTCGLSALNGVSHLIFDNHKLASVGSTSHDFVSSVEQPTICCACPSEGDITQ